MIKLLFPVFPVTLLYSGECMGNAPPCILDSRVCLGAILAVPDVIGDILHAIILVTSIG